MNTKTSKERIEFEDDAPACLSETRMTVSGSAELRTITRKYIEVYECGRGPHDKPVLVGQKEIGAFKDTESIEVEVSIMITDIYGDVTRTGIYIANKDTPVFEALAPGRYIVEWSWTYEGEGVPKSGTGSFRIVIHEGDIPAIEIPLIEITRTIDMCYGTEGEYDEGIDKLIIVD